ncbi:MAG: AMP-binding protein [Proteobacteria bacterium]|nr:AMP-binding protein [Pseudomonadota bacterium]
MPEFCYADVYEAVAQAIPDAPCQIQSERVVSWGDFDRRANALARDMLDAGLARQSKVAAYLYNCPEYVETYVAAFKAGLAPLNTNFRYGPEELRYLWDDADAEAIVFHTGFAETVERVRGSLPRVKRWYAVDDGAGVPDWATSYAEVAEPGAGRVAAPWGRSGDDLLLLYTGGTTGLPKGVMWRQDDLFKALGQGGHWVYGVEPLESADRAGSRLDGPGPTIIPACPLMHGTGVMNALLVLAMGGSNVLLPGRRFDPGELWRTAAERGVFSIALVGDAFARPLLRELEANPGVYDLSRLRLIVSSGVMWSEPVKRGLLERLHSDVTLFDAYGSSEAIGLGASLAKRDKTESTGSFVSGEGVAVFADDGRRLEPGSGEAGRVAIPGHLPLGYYKDPDKTARTFVEHAGVRYSMPGDYARIRADGSLELLGRGSVCINTGGEKVFPEEVEEALKRHPGIVDAACVGVPDERFGEAVCALVEASEPGAEIDPAEAAEFVKLSLAGYKAPRLLWTLDTLGRAPNGKLDYAGLRARAREHFGR